MACGVKDASHVWAVGGSLIQMGRGRMAQAERRYGVGPTWRVGSRRQPCLGGGATRRDPQNERKKVWSPVSLNATNSTLNDVWGADADTIWAVGGGGTIVKWNGSRWTAQYGGKEYVLNSIWGADANHVWAVGKRLHDPQMGWARLERGE